MSLRLGIDIGGTNIAAGILNDKSEIVAKHSIRIKGARLEKEVLDGVRQCALAVCAKAGAVPEDIGTIGIGSPGAIDTSRRIIKTAANLPFDNTFMGDVLSREFGAPVSIANDANTAALGEAVMGSGYGCSSFVMLTLGTGVGGGIVINGRIYGGCNGDAGEIGHMIIERNGRMCRCGQRGCLEAYASANALIRDTQEAMRDDRTSLLWKLAGSLDHVDGRIPFEAKKRDDRTAIKVVEAYSQSLACGITSIIRILQPEVISIGGGISRQGDYLLAPVRKKVYHMIGSEKALYASKLCIAKLGADAGMIGAAILNG